MRWSARCSDWWRPAGRADPAARPDRFPGGRRRPREGDRLGGGGLARGGAGASGGAGYGGDGQERRLPGGAGRRSCPGSFRAAAVVCPLRRARLGASAYPGAGRHARSDSGTVRRIYGAAEPRTDGSRVRYAKGGAGCRGARQLRDSLARGPACGRGSAGQDGFDFRDRASRSHPGNGSSRCSPVAGRNDRTTTAPCGSPDVSGDCGTRSRVGAQPGRSAE